MKTWQPLDHENSLINGRPAEQHPELWRRIAWETAEYHQAGPTVGTVLRVRLRHGARTRHTVSPNGIALALEPGERAVPVCVPAFNELPAVGAGGFIWLLAEDAGTGGFPLRPAAVFPSVVPFGAPFGDCIGG